MNWQDKGYLLSLNKYNENSSIAEFYTENNGKIVGVIFGSTSKKIKSYLLIGNKFHINSKLREDGRLGYLKVEIDEIKTPVYLENNLGVIAKLHSNLYYHLYLNGHSILSLSVMTLDLNNLYQVVYFLQNKL